MIFSRPCVNQHLDTHLWVRMAGGKSYVSVKVGLEAPELKSLASKKTGLSPLDPDRGVVLLSRYVDNIYIYIYNRGRCPAPCPFLFGYVS